MTRAEAIKRLNYLNNKCDPYECIDVKCYKCDEAVEMAIEALRQEPKCEDCKWNTWDNNCMVEYRGCRFEPKNGE